MIEDENKNNLKIYLSFQRREFLKYLHIVI